MTTQQAHFNFSNAYGKPCEEPDCFVPSGEPICSFDSWIFHLPRPRSHQPDCLFHYDWATSWRACGQKSSIHLPKFSSVTLATCFAVSYSIIYWRMFAAANAVTMLSFSAWPSWPYGYSVCAFSPRLCCFLQALSSVHPYPLLAAYRGLYLPSSWLFDQADAKLRRFLHQGLGLFEFDSSLRYRFMPKIFSRRQCCYLSN